MQQHHDEMHNYHIYYTGEIDTLDIQESVMQGMSRRTGEAFIYLFRRFGMPLDGSDNNKEVCAYALSTDMDGVALMVSIGSVVRIGYAISDEIYDLSRREEQQIARNWEKAFISTARKLGYHVRPRHERGCGNYCSWVLEATEENSNKIFEEIQSNTSGIIERGYRNPAYWSVWWSVNNALRNAVKELLRPVSVQDSWININGRVDDDVLPKRLCEEEDCYEVDYRQVAETHKSASYGLLWFANNGGKAIHALFRN